MFVLEFFLFVSHDVFQVYFALAGCKSCLGKIRISLQFHTNNHRITRLFIPGRLHLWKFMFVGKTGNIQNTNKGKEEREILTVNLFIQSLHFPGLLDNVDFASIGFPVFVISSIQSHS